MPALQFSDLDKRHPGISHGIALSYWEAARVCLGRHHSPPASFNITFDDSSMTASVDWSPPPMDLKAAWNNAIDATEQAACCIAIAATELAYGLHAVIRAETLSGADYYLAPAGSDAEDVENLIRLEISGIDKATPQLIQTRLRQKIKQLQNGAANTPGIASVVGFDQMAVASATMP